MTTITLDACRTYNDRLHLQHKCNGDFNKCWRRGLNKTELRLYMEMPNTIIENKQLYEELPSA